MWHQFVDAALRARFGDVGVALVGAFFICDLEEVVFVDLGLVLELIFGDSR